MKKLLAVAVASAFVAPVMAAEITLSGQVEYAYITPDSGDAFVADKGQRVFFNVSQELANGGTIKGDFNYQVENSHDNNGVTEDCVNHSDGGESITISYPELGSLTLGDESSACDKIDDKTDKLENEDLGIGGCSDAAILYQLPKIINGLSVYVSQAPEGQDATHISGEVGEDEFGYSFAYKTSVGIEFGYGFNDENETTDETTTYISYKTGPIYVAAERYSHNEDGADNVEQSGYAATYTMNDLTFILTTKEKKTGATINNDFTAYGVHYNLGGGAKVYAESVSDSKDTTNDSTAIGLKLAF